MLQEISAGWSKPGAALKEVFGHSERARPRPDLDHDSPHQRRDVECREPRTARGPEGAEDHPQNPREVQNQHQNRGRIVDFRPIHEPIVYPC